MPTVRIHPIQLDFKHSGGGQVCNLCGAQEKWASAAQPTVQGAAYDRSLHLAHLVTEHLADVQGTFSNAERGKEKSITDNAPAEEPDETPAE
ncbi:hypothetical protein OOZ19_01260 [Saccharopolyspora sp. NFXS83]|uniref:hypothetical protein n=1 Tax=Saccharopolyspora sp. NFXS83 TaxID=2993560 RepID=UPI00224B293B|nr:hypothetical protein [Saccharopolyspora sp. NFXS83]MCX2728857.1 hypothetical protein [Saccharopolyspora sp. NFXS83]